MNSGTVFQAAIQDARYAWRSMRRSPAFTLTALISLSLAIGANTAIYAIVDAAMLRPLPVPAPASVFALAAPALDATGIAGSGQTEAFSYPLYLRLRAAAADSARLAAFGPADQAEVQGPDPASAGVLGSLGLMRLIHSQLFGMATADPVVMTAAGAAFLLMTSIAVVVPAYRAATMDPLVALRQD
jgi:hypothetical protein